MNIVGQVGAELVNFLKPEDYLFAEPGEVKGTLSFSLALGFLVFS